jgi:transketolase
MTSTPITPTDTNALTDAAAEAADAEVKPAKAKVKTSAMIASIAEPGQRTAPAPLGHALVALAEQNPKIVGLSADLAKYTDMHIFRDRFPERFFQVGMAEQVLLGAAAGLAETGLVPFVSTYSVFAARRAYDFLCLDIAEPNLNVNVVGGLPGLTTGYGPSHQATEDIAIFRGMPNLTIVDPCDSVDIAQAVPQLAAADGPSYLRLLRGNVPTILDEYDYTFELGKAKVLRGGNDVVFISSGLMTMRALQAAKALEAHHVDVAVVHTPTIKPFDAATVLAELNTDRLALTLENHTIRGGLFETVASAAVLGGVHKQILPVALPDKFLDAGALPTLHRKYGLDVDSIVTKVLAGLK